jgi:hypothetical protein
MSDARVIAIKWEAQEVEWTWPTLKGKSSLPRKEFRRLLLLESNRPRSGITITLSRKDAPPAPARTTGRKLRSLSGECSCHYPRSTEWPGLLRLNGGF